MIEATKDKLVHAASRNDGSPSPGEMLSVVSYASGANSKDQIAKTYRCCCYHIIAIARSFLMCSSLDSVVN